MREHLIIKNERAKRTHCCTLIKVFVYIYICIYSISVTKIIRKIRVITIT